MDSDHIMAGGNMHSRLIAIVVPIAIIGGCTRHAPTTPAAGRAPPARVVAVEGVLADFARQVAGDRAVVQALVPPGIDPRGYEPTPGDISAAAKAHLVIANGAGLERFMDALLERAGPDAPAMEASHGLETHAAEDGKPEPHLWLDPVMAVRYVQNIRDALSRADPPGELTYGANGDAYIHQLRDLDAWIADQVNAIPPEKRVLKTDRQELGYFAERYGIQLVPAPGTGPSILVDVTGPSGPGATYLDMMRYDVKLILAALEAP